MLVVLVISVILGKNLEEGFVSYQETLPSDGLATTVLPGYSANLVNKVYDNIFFDTKNGNVIEVDSSAYANAADVTGETIAREIVTTRRGNSKVYDMNHASLASTVVESTTNPVEESDTSWSYLTQSKNTDTYNVFYIPWHNITIVHVLNMTTSIHVGTWIYNQGGVISPRIVPPNPSFGLVGYMQDVDPNNGSMVIEPFYSATIKLYQISKYVKYDITTSNLIVQGGDVKTKTITVYDRHNKSVTVTEQGKYIIPTNAITAVDNAYIITDVLGQNKILYMPISIMTMVALLSYSNSTKDNMILANVCRFNLTGLDTGAPAGPPSSGPPLPIVQPGTGYTGHPIEWPYGGNNGYGIGPHDGTSSNIYNNNSLSDYYSRYWYSQIYGNQPSGNAATSDIPGQSYFNSSDYLLKTQIVPPVCPTCPACPSAATCTNCGGQGGSGTLTTTGQTVVNSGNVVDKTGKLISGTGSGAKQLAEETGSGVKQFAEETGSGVKHFAEEAGSGAAGLLTGAGSGAVGLLTGAGSGIKDILTQGGKNGQDSGNAGGQDGGSSKGGSMGTQNQYTEQYSYYGQLPAKPSTAFMPITANMSSFGK